MIEEATFYQIFQLREDVRIKNKGNILWPKVKDLTVQLCILKMIWNLTCSFEVQHNKTGFIIIHKSFRASK